VLIVLANRDPRMATDMVDFITSILPPAGPKPVDEATVASATED